MTNTYPVFERGYYLVDDEDTYNVKWLEVEDLSYFFLPGEAYYSTKGKRVDETLNGGWIPATTLLEMARSGEWYEARSGEPLTLEKVQTKLLVYEEGLVLFPVNQVNTKTFHAVVAGVRTYYRQISEELEVIEEGELAYAYAHLQEMGLYLTLASDYEGTVISRPQGYWDNVLELQLPEGSVDLYELHINQADRSCRLVPRFLTHILSDIQQLKSLN